ncbi:TolC family protein [Mucilaginibacter terrae]|uniref:TolC family protein n=1 Tax=Mucilaginibacter terrae TaxID=1955052 RepID=UPI00363B34FF
MLFNLFNARRTLLVLSMLSPAVCLAQQTQNLTLDNALLMAHDHSYKLHADSTQIEIVGSRASQAVIGALPELMVNSTFQRLSNNISPFIIQLPAGSFAINPQILNQSYNALQLRQLLFAGGKINNTVKALKKETEASRADYHAGSLALDKQIIDLWFNLYNVKASEKIVTANIEALKSSRNDLEKLRLQGIVLENDVRKVDLSIITLLANLADFTALSGTLNYNLCLAMGIDPLTIILIPDTYIQAVNEVKALSEYSNAAIDLRPELRSLKLRAEAASFMTRATKANYLPAISIIGSYNYDRPNQRIIPNVNAFNYSALAGLNLSWKISALYTNQHQVNERKSIARQLDYTALQEKEEILKEVNSLYLEYKKSKEKLILNESEVLQAAENYRVEGNKLNAQTTTPTDFLIANTSLLQAQLNLATAKANATLAYKKLMLSTGTIQNSKN